MPRTLYDLYHDCGVATIPSHFIFLSFLGSTNLNPEKKKVLEEIKGKRSVERGSFF